MNIGDRFIELKNEDYFVYDEVIVNNTYRVLPEEIYGNIVIDIGAHVGSFALLASCFNPRLIIAVEPDQHNFDKMLKNLKRYNVLNVIPFHRAIASKADEFFNIEGEGVLAKIGKNVTEMFIIANECSEKQIECNIVISETFENLVNKYCRKENELILKIDCEGAEYDILLNTSVDVIKRFKYVYSELHISDNKELLINRFRDCGFENVYMNIADCNGSQVYKWINVG